MQYVKNNKPIDELNKPIYLLEKNQKNHDIDFASNDVHCLWTIDKKMKKLLKTIVNLESFEDCPFIILS